MTDRLHDKDFYAWTQQQARILREAAAARVNLPLDFDDLADEVEDLGRSELRAVDGALLRVIEPLLKLEHSPTADPRNGWKASVTVHRARLESDLDSSPSPRAKIDLPRIYRTARKMAGLGLARDGLTEKDLPKDCPYSLDQILDEDWWPANRHDLID